MADLPPVELARLAEDFRRDRAGWLSGPRIAAVRQRLALARQATVTAAEAVGELRRADLEVAGLDQGEVAVLLDRLDQAAERTARALAELAARGAGRGGARRLPGLFRPPPRFALALRVAELLDAAGAHIGSAEAGPLHDAVLAVLHLAGDGERGLVDVLREVIRSRRENRADQPQVIPCREAAV